MLWLLVCSLVISFLLGVLNGRRELGVWEIFLPLLIIVNYVVYYLWSDSQVRRYEAEHLALGYYANDRKNIPDEQLHRYTRLKNTYVMEVLRNTVLIAVLCGGLVLAGQQLARGSLTGLWLAFVVLLLLVLVRVMQYQRHQISRFGKNGTHIMSR